MRKRYDVIGIGVCTTDICVEVDGYPGPDEKVPAKGIRQQGGGLVGTALVTVARLGGTAAYLGVMGESPFARFCVDDFRREGVETGLIRRTSDAGAWVGVVVVDRSAGTRAIAWTGDGAPVLQSADITSEIIGQARVLHVDDYIPEPSLLGARIARSLGVPVTMDLELAGAQADEFLRLGDYVVVPLAWVQERCGVQNLHDAAEALFRQMRPHGGRAAVVTAGDRGSVAASATGVVVQPAYRTHVVDTTGCGDVYHGAFALGVARGWDLQTTMRYAAGTAALKCRKPGGRDGIPTSDQVEAFLKMATPVQ
jgi:ribokinase